MKLFKEIDWKDIGERCLKTFIQAFVATVAASDIFNLSGGATIKSAVVTTVIAAIAAGVSAVWNVVAGAIAKGA